MLKVLVATAIAASGCSSHAGLTLGVVPRGRIVDISSAPPLRPGWERPSGYCELGVIRGDAYHCWVRHLEAVATLTASGALRDLELLFTMPESFTEAVAGSLGACTFEPARQGGEPVVARVHLHIGYGFGRKWYVRLKDACPVTWATRSSELDGLVLPQRVSRCSADYPRGAVLSTLWGTVSLAAVVDQRGTVAHATVVEGVHDVLDRAALRTLMKCRFEPGRLHGVPVAVRIPYRFTFAFFDRRAVGALRRSCNAGELGDCIDLASSWLSSTDNTEVQQGVELLEEVCPRNAPYACLVLGDYLRRARSAPADDTSEVLARYRQGCDGGAPEACIAYANLACRTDGTCAGAAEEAGRAAYAVLRGVDALSALGFVLCRAGSTAEAEALYRRACDILAPRPCNPKCSESRFRIFLDP